MFGQGECLSEGAQHPTAPNLYSYNTVFPFLSHICFPDLPPFSPLTLTSVEAWTSLDVGVEGIGYGRWGMKVDQEWGYAPKTNYDKAGTK